MATRTETVVARVDEEEAVDAPRSRGCAEPIKDLFQPVDLDKLAYVSQTWN
jgi:hypothetical protein